MPNENSSFPKTILLCEMCEYFTGVYRDLWGFIYLECDNCWEYRLQNTPKARVDKMPVKLNGVATERFLRNTAKKV